MGIIVSGIVLYVVQNIVTSIGAEKPHKRHRYIKIRKTPASSEFKEIYNYIISEYAEELEGNRKKLKKSIIICCILFIISTLIYIFLIKKMNKSLSKGSRTVGLIFIPAGMYYIFKYKKYNAIYVENYKNNVIKNFVEYINHNLHYDQYGGDNLLDSYIKAEFMDDEFNSFITDDYIEGYIEDETYIKMCNISLENTNDKGEFLDMIYEGIFSVTQLNIHIPNEIRIIKNKYIKKDNYKKVQMDSKEFEKYFDVYSTSDILSMEILTHDIMEELVQFYEKYKIKYEIIIKDNNIYIRFDTGVMFEPNILKKSNDVNTLWIYYNILIFTINLTTKINKLLKDIEI